jgi:hypothetical protein
MGKEKKEEQEFLRDVDRFLKGEEVSPGEDASEETRSTTEFAKKLIELRAAPSPEFRERLKSKLLRKLSEKEDAARERAKSGWFTRFLDRLIPQSPVWRTAVVTVAIVVAAAGVMWRTGLFTTTVAPGGDAEMADENGRGLEEMAADVTQKDWSQSDVASVGEEEEEDTFVTSPPPGTEDDENILGEELKIEIEVSPADEITILVEPCTVLYGTDVHLVLDFRNNGSELITVKTGQISILNSPELEFIYTLPAVDGLIEISPSESFQMLFVWEQKDNNGTQVPAGTYRFNVGLIIITHGTDSYELSPPMVDVLIVEP